jgi:hypothetical protein
MVTDSGLLYCSNRWATFGIVINNGRVVDAAPYAWGWIRGKTMDELWRGLSIAGYRVEWLPDER